MQYNTMQSNTTMPCDNKCISTDLLVLLGLGLALPYCNQFIHFEYFYIASTSPLLLRGAPDYSMDTVSEYIVGVYCRTYWALYCNLNHYNGTVTMNPTLFQVKDLPKVAT